MRWTALGTASTSCWSTCAGASCRPIWTLTIWCAKPHMHHACVIVGMIMHGMRLQVVQHVESHARQGTMMMPFACSALPLLPLTIVYTCWQASLHRLGSALEMSDSFWRALALHPAAMGGGADGGALCNGGGGGGGGAGLKGILKHDNGGSNGAKRRCAAGEPGSDVPPPLAPRAKAYRRYHAKVVACYCLLL